MIDPVSFARELIDVPSPTDEEFEQDLALWTDGRQVAAPRYCFDFGRYPTGDPARLHEANMNFLSLWYTAGCGYGLNEGEWKMTGGAENADSILIASEPLTRDIASWVEVPEYSVLHAEIRGGRPKVELHYLD